MRHSMNYSVVYGMYGGGMGMGYYGNISTKAAHARARRLSRHQETRKSAREWNAVTLFGHDDDGAKASFVFHKGKMVEKKICPL